MDVYAKLKELNIELPAAPAKGGAYTSVKVFGGNLVYVSGCGPQVNGTCPTGKLGREIDIETGKLCARNSMLNVLAAVEKEIGDLNRIADVVKVLCFVSSVDDFTARRCFLRNCLAKKQVCRPEAQSASTFCRAISRWRSKLFLN